MFHFALDKTINNVSINLTLFLPPTLSFYPIQLYHRRHCFHSRFAEFKRTFGGNLICGFGLLRGRLVGFLANCGQISAADAQKGAHFVANCDQGLRGLRRLDKIRTCLS